MKRFSPSSQILIEPESAPYCAFTSIADENSIVNLIIRLRLAIGNEFTRDIVANTHGIAAGPAIDSAQNVPALQT